LRVTIPL